MTLCDQIAFPHFRALNLMIHISSNPVRCP